MDLQDWPDSELDGWVNAALKSETFVSERQKQRAWVQVRQKAAQQPMLPPIKSHRTAESRVDRLALRDLIMRPCRWLVTWIGDLMVEDGLYARANHRRNRLVLYEFHQTYMIYRLPA